jgi:hypothetical protein
MDGESLSTASVLEITELPFARGPSTMSVTLAEYRYYDTIDLHKLIINFKRIN